MAPEGPLAGIRVVELAVVIAGPAAAAMLGDWGADVVKVEPPEGDVQRGNPVTAYFELDNRAKRSIALDLKNERGREIVLRLLDGADVFVTNLRLSALARLGLDYDSLSRRNPRLVYGIITGYGTQGPAAHKPGYDVGAFWSRAGVASTLVGAGTEPPVPRPGLGDHPAGMALVAGIVAALFERERTGRGRLVTTSLLRAGMYSISSDLNVALQGHEVNAGMRRAMGNPLLACYASGDRRWFWLLGLQPERHWGNVTRAVQRPELEHDDRFRSFGRMLRNAAELIAILDDEFAKRPLAEWAEIFDREDVWWDPVLDVHDVLTDPAVRAAGGLRPAEEGGWTVAAPVDFTGFDPPAVRRAPEAGEHTEEILLEHGYDWADIATLQDDRAIP